MNVTYTAVARGIARVRVSLRTLDRALRRMTPALTSNMKVSGNGAAKRAVRVSAKTRVARVLQGRYMGYMRQLKPRQKDQVRKIREAKGVRVAIARARTLAG